MAFNLSQSFCLKAEIHTQTEKVIAQSVLDTANIPVVVTFGIASEGFAIQYNNENEFTNVHQLAVLRTYICSTQQHLFDAIVNSSDTTGSEPINIVTAQEAQRALQVLSAYLDQTCQISVSSTELVKVGMNSYTGRCHVTASKIGVNENE